MYEAVQKTDQNLEERITYISEMLKNHKYVVGRYRTSLKWDRTKMRILYKLPYYPDRIIQWAIMLQIEQDFQRVFCDFSCASLPNKGIHYASSLIQKYINTDSKGTRYYLKFDIKKFYPSINRSILKRLLRKLFKDKDLLYELDNIIDSFENADIDHLNLSQEDLRIYKREGYGLPVGSYLSQYLANFYLSYFDHWLKEECGCKYVVRYMDDVLIFSDSKQFLHNLLCACKIYLHTELDITLKGNYIIRPTTEGIDMVGYVHFRTHIQMRDTTFLRTKRLFDQVSAATKITEKQWRGCISSLGWLAHADSYTYMTKLSLKFFYNLNSYYYANKSSIHNRKFDVRRIYYHIYKSSHSYRGKEVSDETFI